MNWLFLTWKGNLLFTLLTWAVMWHMFGHSHAPQWSR
jgi:hypothetical protein